MLVLKINRKEEQVRITTSSGEKIYLSLDLFGETSINKRTGNIGIAAPMSCNIERIRNGKTLIKKPKQGDNFEKVKTS